MWFCHLPSDDLEEIHLISTCFLIAGIRIYCDHLNNTIYKISGTQEILIANASFPKQ